MSLFRLYSSAPRHNRDPGAPQSRLQMAAMLKEPVMEKANHFAAEIAAQVALALVVGVFVSVVLAGATMLLAAA